MMDYTAGMRRRVGWLVIVGIAAVMSLLLVLTFRSDLLAPKFRLLVFPTSADAFHVGQDVKFQGLVIGQVDDIELTRDGKVRVVLRLLERYRPLLHQGASVHLRKQALFGEPSLEMTAGDPQAPVLADHDIVGYVSEASLQQLLHDLRPAVKHANSLLAKLDELAGWLNDPDADLRALLADARQVSRELKASRVVSLVQRIAATVAKVEAVVRSLEQQQVAEHLSESLKQTSAILAKMQPLAQSLGEQGGDTIRRVNDLMAQLDRLSRTLNAVAADLSKVTPELPGLVQDSRRTIAQLHGMLEGLRRSWPFKATAPDDEEPALAPPQLDLRP